MPKIMHIKKGYIKVIILAIFVVIGLYFIFSYSTANKTVTEETSNNKIQPTLCQTIPFSSPSEAEVSFNKSILEDSSVQYVRTALDVFLANSYVSCTTDDCASGLLNDVHYMDSANYELQNISSDYLKSKFIILSLDMSPGGGKSIVLMFKDMPDKLFYAWVYDYRDSSGHNQGFDLRGFNEYNLKNNGAPDMETTQKSFIN